MSGTRRPAIEHLGPVRVSPVRVGPVRARPVAVIAMAAAAGVLLAGCAAGRDEATSRAAAVFDGLVAAAAGVDASVLRTLEVRTTSEAGCGDDTDDVQTTAVATGTLAVAATAADLDSVADTVVGALDGDGWRAIEPTEGLVQRAYQDADGTRATVTEDGRVLVIAVFSACFAPS